MQHSADIRMILENTNRILRERDGDDPNYDPNKDNCRCHESVHFDSSTGLLCIASFCASEELRITEKDCQLARDSQA
jgi:hypothetical protein